MKTNNHTEVDTMELPKAQWNLPNKKLARLIHLH